MQDSKLLSLLDSSRWLYYVSTCLALASQAADSLCAGSTVVLQEGIDIFFYIFSNERESI